jgi:hypothetical protein
LYIETEKALSKEEGKWTSLLAVFKLTKLRAALLELWLLEIDLCPLKDLGTIEKTEKRLNQEL